MKSREALFDPTDLGIAPLTSSDSLAFDQYPVEQQQQMTDFNQAFYSLCAKTPSGSAPEPISDESVRAAAVDAARANGLQVSTDEDSGGDCIVTERVRLRSKLGFHPVTLSIFRIKVVSSTSWLVAVAAASRPKSRTTAT